MGRSRSFPRRRPYRDSSLSRSNFGQNSKQSLGFAKQFMPEYKDYIEANADVADKLAGLIADFVDYGNTKNKLERLTAKLELPGK